MTIDRDQIDQRKNVVVHQSGDHAHEEQVVQNVNVDRESFKLTPSETTNVRNTVLFASVGAHSKRCSALTC